MFKILAAALLAAPSVAQVSVADPYARASGPSARAGAAFMEITSEADDRLVAASSDVAQRVELHTHIAEGGVMRMREVEGGIALPANEPVLLQRGGLHVMLMGLTRPLATGDTVEIELIFDTAPPLTITVPVDNARRPED